MTTGRATAGGSPCVLSRRTLNRTLLRRQHLLERVRRPALAVVESLVGLQAQEPVDPYVALWSRIDGFDPVELSAAIDARRAVRMGLMRGTLHLATAADALGVAPVMAEVHERSFRGSPFAKALVGADIPAIVAAARAVLAVEPMAPADLGRRLVAHWPDLDPSSMAACARYFLPLVQVPPRGLWGRSGRAVNTTADAWLGSPLGPATSRETIVERYLRAFGPAAVADIRTWSWLTGLRETVEGMRPRFRTYRDEAGRELFDVEDGRIDDPDLPAPVRFLPQFDNVFLSHADRSRINGSMPWGLEFGWKGPILVDGFIAGAWRVRRDGRAATMTVELGADVEPADRVEVEAEATRLLAYLAPDTEATAVSIVADADRP